ncbi:MAG TPA: CPBP family intramembrane glutamic endopeptidase [Acidimicrobiales bacterium]|nr:CPBP family intramembrane glutamic endopeptidase [Acidimicrobiales bacterium]
MGASIGAAVSGADLGETSLATSIGSLIGMWLVYVVVIATTVRNRGGSLKADTGLRVRPIDALLGVVGGLVSSIVVVRLVYVVLQLVSIVDRSDLDRLDDPAKELSDVANGWGFLVLAVFVGIGAPVVEELFFRGFLQPAAIAKLGVPGGILFTSVVFGAVHFQLLQFPALAVFGVILGWLAHRYRRLGPAIFTHVVFNGLTLIALAAS